MSKGSFPVGTFNVGVQVGDLTGRTFVDIEALVDTGATHTVLPEDLLARLGIRPEGWRRFELADDRLVEYPIGYARLRYDGADTIALIVFAPLGTRPLLGATALENLSLAVDPVRRRLVPVTALLK